MRIIFLHIPKAGGTTFHSILEGYFDQEVIKKPSVENGFLDFEVVNQLSKEEKSKIRLIKGHIYYGIHKAFDDNIETKYISFLREPISRLTSHYFYAKSTPIHYLYNKINDGNITLEQYLLSDMSTELDNGQVRLISGIDSPINQCTNEHLEIAIRNIERDFVLCGTIEQFDSCLLLLKHKLNWNSYPFYKIMNQGAERKDIKLSEEVLEKVKIRNALAIQLYNKVSENLNAEISRYPKMNEELALFQKLNAEYSHSLNSKEEEIPQLKRLILFKLSAIKKAIKKFFRV